MNTEKVYIEKMVYGGLGLGHLASGQIVLVERALPEETLIVTIQQEKKNHLFAKITEILQPHPSRISPLCPYHQCGGCNLHHSAYTNQLTIKEMMLTDLLQRQTDKTLATMIAKVRKPILPAAEEFAYRQRIRLHIHKGKMGFQGRGSHSLVAINHCRIARKNLNMVLSSLQQESEAQHLLSVAREIELLENPEDNTVVLLLFWPRPPRAKDRKNAENLALKIPLLERVFFIGEKFALEGPYPQHLQGNRLCYREEIHGKRIEFGFKVGGFCQVNLAQNRKLITTVCTMADIQPGEKVLDLYCGMGNFALPLAAFGADVYGIEGQGGAIRSARENADRTKLSARFDKSPVETACRRLAAEKHSFATVIIDPPRRGVPQLAETLAQLTTKKLIYVSCDPATLMRDLLSLYKAGFTVTAFQPVDMFPQTHHIESVVQLIK